MKRIPVLFALSALAATAPAVAQDRPELEHFQCYPVLRIDPEIAATVELTDQFGVASTADVRRARRFCNPTRKIHRGTAFGIDDIRQHLTMYSIFPVAGPLRVVSIRNQFGTDRLLLRGPVVLAAPTQKAGHQPPVGLDHFQCYAASGRSVNQGVGLSDQFILPVTAHRVLDPVLFCNPARKVHGDVTTPILNPAAHLTCYVMTRVLFTGTTGILNQFGPQTLTVGPPDMLCVPTVKVAWFVIDDAPAGAPDVDVRVELDLNIE